MRLLLASPAFICERRTRNRKSDHAIYSIWTHAIWLMAGGGKKTEGSPRCCLNFVHLIWFVHWSIACACWKSQCHAWFVLSAFFQVMLHQDLKNRKVSQIEPKPWKIKHETLHEVRLRPSTVLSWPVPNRPEMADDPGAESIRILQMYLDGMLESMCDEARMEWLLGNTFCSVIELLLRICISFIWYQAWRVKQAGAFVREADRTFWAPARVWDAAQWKCPCIRANANSWGLCSYASSLNVCFTLRCDDFAGAWQKISSINCQRCRPLRLIYNLFLQKIQDTVTAKRLGDLRSTNVQKIAELKDSEVQASRDWMLFFCCFQFIAAVCFFVPVAYSDSAGWHLIPCGTYKSAAGSKAINAAESMKLGCKNVVSLALSYLSHALHRGQCVAHDFVLIQAAKMISPLPSPASTLARSIWTSR